MAPQFLGKHLFSLAFRVGDRFSCTRGVAESTVDYDSQSLSIQFVLNPRQNQQRVFKWVFTTGFGINSAIVG
jgi:hypothetical protein